MSKQEWTRHKADVLSAASYAIGEERSILREHIAQGCTCCNARRRTIRANRSRRETDGIRRSLGLVKTPYGWE